MCKRIVVPLHPVDQPTFSKVSRINHSARPIFRKTAVSSRLIGDVGVGRINMNMRDSLWPSTRDGDRKYMYMEGISNSVT